MIVAQSISLGLNRSKKLALIDVVNESLIYCAVDDLKDDASHSEEYDFCGKVWSKLILEYEVIVSYFDST